MSAKSKMKIGSKVLEILKPLSTIYQGVILNEDILYTKFIASQEVKVKTKGTEAIIVNYKVPEGELQLDGKEIGIGDINHFLSVINTYNPDTLEVSTRGLSVALKDNRKKGTYVSQTTSTLPERNEMADQIFESGDALIKFTLLETERAMILKDLNPVDPDEMTLRVVDGKLILSAMNEKTSNDIDIEISNQNVQMADGEFKFPNPDILNLIASDDYVVSIVEAEGPGGEEFKIIKLEAVKLKGLYYMSVYTEDEE